MWRDNEESESEVAQLCLTICNPMDCSLPVSSIHGIFQARVLKWVAISFPGASSWPRDCPRVSCIVSRCFPVWVTWEDGNIEDTSIFYSQSDYLFYSFLILPSVQLLSCVGLFVTPWAVACQSPPSMGFSRKEYWSGLPFPSPGNLPDPGIKPWSPALQADSLPSEPPGKPV